MCLVLGHVPIHSVYITRNQTVRMLPVPFFFFGAMRILPVGNYIQHMHIQRWIWMYVHKHICEHTMLN